MSRKPAPAPQVPGKTEAERFDYAVRKVFSGPTCPLIAPGVIGVA
jgi:hypothetical protein